MKKDDVILVDDGYKVTRIMYLLEAAFEYFISLSFGGAYLSRITAYLGISDSVTATLTSVVALTHLFMFGSLLLAHFNPVKRWVVGAHILSHTFAIFIYFIPVLNLSLTLKTILLFVLLGATYAIHYVVNAPKISWLMSAVNDSKRGEYTAIKEIISLLGGTLFVYLLGYCLDIANKKTAFIVVGIILIIVCILHTLTLIFSKEKPLEFKEKVNLKENIKSLFTNKEFLKVVVILCVWYLINHGVVNFTGTYQVNELKFTATYTSIISIIAMLARAVLSKQFGKFGDKHTFMKLIILSFCIETVAFLCLAFTIPSNGKVMYMVYSILHSVGMAGISMSLINLTYEVVSRSQRTSAYAVANALAGISGFVVTLILNPIFDHIQASGNRVFGLSLYAQQFFAIIAVVCLLVVIIWLTLKQKRKSQK